MSKTRHFNSTTEAVLKQFLIENGDLRQSISKINFTFPKDNHVTIKFPHQSLAESANALFRSRGIKLKMEKSYEVNLGEDAINVIHIQNDEQYQSQSNKFTEKKPTQTDIVHILDKNNKIIKTLHDPEGHIKRVDTQARMST